jgi:NADH:ubiquinone reductase (H+-translocating)
MVLRIVAAVMGTAPKRVVIVGGGFGGVQCARTLRRRLTAGECEIVLFNRENHMVFHPLLPEVAGASLNPDAVAAPLRQMLAAVRCRTETVRNVDLNRQVVEFDAHNGHTGTLSYDHLVIACGRSVNLGSVPGMSDHAFALKTVGDAMALRAHVIQQLENAEVCEDPARRRWYLSFIAVGGGFSGVEVAGEINDLVRHSQRFYPNISADEISVTLIHSGDHILPELSMDLRTFAEDEMRKAGISIVLNGRVSAATADGVWLKDDRQFRGATTVCTVGTGVPLLVERLESPKERGSLLTQPDMRLDGNGNAWAIGDCARVVNDHTGDSCPPTGQFAERQGRQVAENIVRAMRGQSTRPFTYKPLGVFCAIGGRNAVAEILGYRISGFLAWFLWRSVYLFKLPSWSRRVKVGADWAWDLLFARDLVNMKTDPTERVSRAYFRPGDFVFRQGEPALNFYSVETGTLDVVRTNESEGSEQLVAVIGPGDFFGEMALIEGRARSASVRARTPVEVTTLGAHVFSRISKTLAPLQQRLAEAIRQRTTSPWTRLPQVHAMLSAEPVSAFVEPAPYILGGDSAFEEVLEIFATHHADTVYILDEGRRIVGVITRTDLFRVVDVVAVRPIAERRSVVIRSLMSPDPLVMTMDDTAAAAALAMWSRGLKSLPVVTGPSGRLVGCIRAETVMQAVLRRLAHNVVSGVNRTGENHELDRAGEAHQSDTRPASAGAVDLARLHPSQLDHQRRAAARD